MNIRNEGQNKDPAEILSSFAKQAVASAYTSLPAVIKAYYPETNTADIEFTVEQSYYNSDNILKYMSLTPLFKVPVMLTRAFNTVVTLPITKGDECWVSFSHKSMENFIATGKQGEPKHLENGSFLDALISMQQLSKPKNSELKNIASNVYQIRKTDNNDSYIEYKASADTTTIKASSEVSEVVSPDSIILKAGSSVITVNKDGSVSIKSASEIDLTAPTIKLNASGEIIASTPILTVTGVIAAGAGVDNVKAAVSTFTGGLVGTNGDIVADGISLKGHTHPDSGANSQHNTGAPNG